MPEKIKVLIVDDSALIRQLLTQLLADDASIEVVGSASDPFIAREKIKTLAPDVLTLDVEMPRMDGLTFLRNLMRLHPMPVVMISSLTEQGADVTLDALEIGAVDFVTKPKVDVAHALADYGAEIIRKIKMAAAARVRPRGDSHAAQPKPDTRAAQADGAKKLFRTTDRLIAIGASTGGTEAIKEVLEHMPANAPGIVITQHIPAAFSRPFAERMNRSSPMRVKEAEDGDLILPGHVFIAPGDQHLVVVRDGARYRCRLNSDPPVGHHRPSVDVLFHSVAKSAGQNAVAALLTGMGDDGAAGMLAIKEAGGPTIAQDEATCVVWGMPGEAVKRGAAEEVLPLTDIAARLLEISSGK